jgi:hypothetical protein
MIIFLYTANIGVARLVSDWEATTAALAQAGTKEE